MNQVKLNTTASQIFLQILLFGGVWLFIPLIFNDFSLNSYDFKKSVQNLLGITLIIILNMKWLLPQYYFQDKKPLYLGLSILSILVIYFGVDFFVNNIIPFESARPPAKRNQPPPSTFYAIKSINRIMPCILALVGSSLYEISRFANQQLKQAAQLRGEKLSAEMKLLKSKMNPHFLFNALNNVYSLSYLKPEKTPENLLKLSNMLRYMLYECNVDRVALSKEIAYLKDFINLQMLKDSRGMNVKVDLEVTHPNLLIAPMLLIPFVENAFKHSHIEDLENGWIDLQLSTNADAINFKISNSIQAKEQPKDTVGGIGLPTAKRLLELHYPKQHQLKINQTADQYSVELNITVQ